MKRRDIALLLLGWLPTVALTEGSPPEGAAPLSLQRCLPVGIHLNDVVEVTASGSADGKPGDPHKVMVEQKLLELKATCGPENKLIDGPGREIFFYHLTGCWGHPPPDYQELLQKQRRELDELKIRYTVVEMTCNPSGVRIP